MLSGRTAEITELEKSYASGRNTLTILYGRSNIGKTALIRHFVKNKPCFYYSAVQASDKEQTALLKKEMMRQGLISTYDVQENYAAVLKNAENIDNNVKLIIIEEFQNIIKNNKEFMSVIADMVKLQNEKFRVMIICTSSSISWIENNLVTAIGSNAMAITSFIKLKELSFVDTVRMFPGYSVPDSMIVYAVTGGVPGYMRQFTDAYSIKENICKNILTQGKLLYNEGSDFIKEELRETSLYNTILFCIANGEYKLNELHVHTGFGRDKISVYLKNLIEREIVDKIFSYDIGGKEYTRKGLYRIKSAYTEFWFRYIYGNESALSIMSPEEFFDEYIAGSLQEFAAETFIKVGTEFIELLDSMDKLEIKIDRRGRWWGKNGNIDMIACDKENHYIVAKFNWQTKMFTFEMFEELMYQVNLAGIGKDYIYLFSRETFDEELKAFAADNSNVRLVSLNDL
ncbi:MAG: ATP-binding protein [Eubacteriales bacterium]|nr:ATP-binding protein [Eubacteriales bacterium]